MDDETAPQYVCQVCGLDWERHRSRSGSVNECIELLRHDLAAARKPRPAGAVRAGDLLEWIAAVALTVGVYLGTRYLWVSLLVAGVCLAYFAQCYSTVSLPRPRRRIRA